eukprot:905833-Rhodomonas_salina.1
MAEAVQRINSTIDQGAHSYNVVQRGKWMVYERVGGAGWDLDESSCCEARSGGNNNEEAGAPLSGGLVGHGCGRDGLGLGEKELG